MNALHARASVQEPTIDMLPVSLLPANIPPVIATIWDNFNNIHSRLDLLDYATNNPL